MSNPLLKVKQMGQSIWLDYISRDILQHGKIERMIIEDALSGMTSNPAIFEKAIGSSDLYDDDIHSLADSGKSPQEIYETIAIQDVQHAADLFTLVYNETNGWDGYVSLEVNPHLAMDAVGTIKEARRLWEQVNRQNIYIKVPGTLPGLIAVETLISEGINVNITLLFGLKRYREFTKAYIRGIEKLLNTGKPVENISSVASFFVSRMDTLVDPKIQEFVGENGEQAHFGSEGYGQTGIANAILAHEIFKEVFHSEHFKHLKSRGANVQRLLWASTSTKNPDFPDVKYMDALLIPGTINTVPPETLDAYRDHGKIEDQKLYDPVWAQKIINQLPEMGIDINQVTDELEREGIEKFNQPYDKMLKSLREKMAVLR
ncbi:MAG: transaldolase [Syntrophothermus sp.]